ncbi:CMRF35-like molecule 1 [Trichomycterus rosablanca]|uniref:CMRF35-like molecule 1 n=1 Tax=Trichomycterus rosablanca TaxID=2290929 RepID=UPI002F351C17
MKSRAERVITGTEGGKVEIDCKYSDEYIYSAMFFCRDPCGYSDVLIQSETVKQTVSKGRYMAINTVSARSFFVTIRNLMLRDTGVYYCGIEKWGKDKLIKVKVIVTKAPAMSTRAPVPHQSKLPETSEPPSATIVNTTSAGTEHSSVHRPKTSELFNVTTVNTTTAGLNTEHLSEVLTIVSAGVFGLLLCCVLVAVVVFHRKRSSIAKTFISTTSEIQMSHQPPNQEEVGHTYDEICDVHTLPMDSSEIYSTIQFPLPVENDCSPYSLVVSH